jgi:hypothetical protein
MRQRRDRLRLALEAHARLRVARHALGEDFHRHVAVEARVARAVDVAHSARADRFDDGVRAEACAWRK